MQTLTSAFEWLLAASLRASVLTVAVLLLQTMLRRHLSPRWRHILWLPVLLVLLTPVFPESAWSLEGLLPQQHTQVVEVSPQLPAPSAPSDWPASDALTPQAPSKETLLASLDLMQWSALAWLAGACVLLGAGLVSFARTLHRFKTTRAPISEVLQHLIERAAQESALRSAPEVWVSRAVSSPAVAGLLRPVLLLPAHFQQAFTPAEVHLILRHELTHLKRHDLPMNALMCLLLALHWFNPVLWFAFFKVRTDREAACDAQVLGDSAPAGRMEYGHTLLKVESAFSPLSLSLGFVGLFQRGAALRSRIRAIASQRRTRPATQAFSVTAVALMTFLGVTRAQQPTTAAKDDQDLITVQIKMVEFTKPTTWNFNGRMPTESQNQPVGILLTSEEATTLLRDLAVNKEADIMASPRMVTKNHHKVEVRSVVNQPYKTPEGTVKHLPIGLTYELTPSLKDSVFSLDIEMKNSRLADPQTGETVGTNQGDKPNVITISYQAPHQFPEGQSLVIAMWADGKPENKRPILHIVTPSRTEKAKKSSAGAAPSEGIYLAEQRESGRVPRIDSAQSATGTRAPAAGGDGSAFLTNKVEKIILPKVDFNGAKLSEILEFFRVESRRQDTTTDDPKLKGVPILLRQGDGQEAEISLTLRNVPLKEALSYATQLANHTYKVEPYAVIVKPLPAAPGAGPSPTKPQVTLTGEKTTYDSQRKVSTATGNAECKVGSVTFQGAEMIFDEKAGTLTVRAPFVIQRGKVATQKSTGDNAVAVYDTATGQIKISGPHKIEMLDSVAAEATTQPKLVLAQVKLRDATLEESLASLREAVRQLGAAQQSVQILNQAAPSPAKISLDLKEVPLETALKYLAELFKLTVTQDGSAYVLKPKN